MAQATAQGVPTNVSTNPRSASIGGIPFSPLADDQWDLIVAAWGGGKEVVVTYDEGPPKSVTKVASA